MEAPFGGFKQSGVGRDRGLVRTARLQRAAEHRLAQLNPNRKEALMRGVVYDGNDYQVVDDLTVKRPGAR